MMNYSRLAAGVAISALAAASAAYAQETTGSIRGRVTDAGGAAVAGAAVSILHVPTGTRVGAITSEDGVYVARGLRIGGPYELSAVKDGMEGETTLDLIGIGGAASADIAFGEDVTEVEEIVASGVARSGANYTNTSRFNASQIADQPSINRDLKDTVRVDPFVQYDIANQKALIVGGVSNRYNSITVDGVKQNDDFGLNNNGYPTQRSPISVDAVAAVAVNTAPFSVIYNDFLGANLNAVTKSGTNEFHGSLFIERLAAKKWPISSDDVQEEIWGATLGGPLIKDRLFFFGAYENYESTAPFPSGPAGSGRLTEITGTTPAQVTEIENILSTVYGFSYDQENSILNSPDLAITDEKKFIRLDANVSARHRLQATWQETYGEKQIEGIRASNTVTRLLPLESHYYKLSDALEVYTAQLNSDWTDQFSTELTYNHKVVVRGQVPIAGCFEGPDATGDETCEFGQFTTFVTNTETINAGPDTSRHANELDTKFEGYQARARYELERHSLLAGIEFETIDVFNLFAASTEGVWTFRPTTANAGLNLPTATGLQNLAARRATQLSYSNALIDVNGDGVRNELDAAAEFAYDTTSYYVEDEFRFNDDVSILFGLRFDTISSDDRPPENTFFTGRYGFSNTSNLDGLDVWLPRVGVRWDVNDTTRISGGFGLFSGGSPNVWVSNNYSSNGVVLGTITCDLTSTNATTSTCDRDTALAVLNGGVDGFDVPDRIEALLDPTKPAFASVRRASTVNALDPNFKVPQSWKASLSLSTELMNWRLGADMLYTDVKEAVTWIDLRGGLTPVGTAPDGRPIYNNRTQRAALIGATGQDGGSDILLTNTDQGWSRSVAVSARRIFDNGFDVRFSHTWNTAKDINPGTNSTAGSSFGNNAVSDPLNPGLSRSNYEIKESTKANINWTKEWFKGFPTTVTVYAEHRTGLPYSMVFRPVTSAGSTTNAAVDYFGDISTARQLLYVPTGVADPIISYENQLGTCNPCQTASQTQALLNDFIDGSGLAAFRGKIAPRNAFLSPSNSRVDIRVSQELPGFFPETARFRAYMDVENFGNMLNDEWGILEQVEFAYMAPIVDVRLVNGRYLYSNFRTPVTQTSNSDAPNRSIWAVKLGLAYNF